MPFDEAFYEVSVPTPAGATRVAFTPFMGVFTLDLTPPAPPTVTNFSMAPAINDSSNDTVTLQGLREDNSAVWIDGMEQVPPGIGPWSHVMHLPQGPVTVDLFARDLAGNTSGTVHVEFLIDSVDPFIFRLERFSDSEVVIAIVEETSGVDLTNSLLAITHGGMPVAGSWSATARELTFTPAMRLGPGG